MPIAIPAIPQPTPIRLAANEETLNNAIVIFLLQK